MRAWEELNHILMERFQNEEKDKRTESEDMPYQHKDKKSKKFKIFELTINVITRGSTNS